MLSGVIVRGEKSLPGRDMAAMRLYFLLIRDDISKPPHRLRLAPEYAR